MKNLIRIQGCCATIAAALLFIAANTLAQTPTVNVGPGDGWTLFGGASWVEGNTILAQNAPNNNWNNSGGYEIVNGISVGLQYTFTTDYLTDTGISLTSFNPVCLLLTFENSSWVNIGTVEYGYGYDSGGYNYFAPAKDTWYEGSVSGTAPVGATSVVAYAFFIDDGQTTTENIYFQNMSLTPLPTPEPTTSAVMVMGLIVSFALLGNHHGFLLSRFSLFKRHDHTA